VQILAVPHFFMYRDSFSIPKHFYSKPNSNNLMRLRHRCVWTSSLLRMSHSTRTNESQYTYEWVIVYVRMMTSATRMNESCHKYECITSHTWNAGIRCDESISCVMERISCVIERMLWKGFHVCDGIPSYLWHDWKYATNMNVSYRTPETHCRHTMLGL